MRQFETGATRDQDENKFDYEGFLSPAVLERFASYMHKNRKQADGKLRDSDNWQKGIPQSAYMKSMFRHFMEVWHAHRGDNRYNKTEALCALLFNVMGYLHEELRGEAQINATHYDRDAEIRRLAEAIQSQDRAERELRYTDLSPETCFQLPYGHTSLSTLSNMEHSEVYGLSPLGSPSEVATLAPEVRGATGITATIPKR